MALVVLPGSGGCVSYPEIPPVTADGRFHTYQGLLDIIKIVGLIGFCGINWGWIWITLGAYLASSLLHVLESERLDQLALEESKQRALDHEGSGRYLQLREWNGHIDP